MTRNLTQTELARRPGTSRQALGTIESGAYHLGVAFAPRIAPELGTSKEALIGECDSGTSTLFEASWFDDEPLRNPAALARVSGKVVAFAPSAPHLTLAPTAGVVKRTRRHRADVDAFQLHNEIESTRFVQ